MTLVQISRLREPTFMEFAFEEETEAFAFYALAKDHYREDDLCICMTEEELPKVDSLLDNLLEKGIAIRLGKDEDDDSF